ncbi:MAG: DUF523 and DUF1722 domain-containing protein [Thermodesulfobacteriota bacterium]
MTDRIRIGVSACLLGQLVRYDGGHRLERFITDTLGQYVEFVPVCPEAEAGLGIPREAMRLEGDPWRPRLVTIRTQMDHTERMLAWAKQRVRELEDEDLCGLIVKSNSPSCGKEWVKVYKEKGMPEKKGVGLFARVFMKHFPLIPAEDEGRLYDPGLREHFIESIFTLKRWRELLKGRPGLGVLADFHTRHELLLLSHSEKHYRAMGKLVAAGKTMSARTLYERYEAMLLESLRLRTTVKKNANVLYRLMGYFKKNLSEDEKQELLEIIGRYRAGNIPLVVPVTLSHHYVRKYKQPCLAEQTYLNRHPVELQLRNHV